MDCLTIWMHPYVAFLGLDLLYPSVVLHTVCFSHFVLSTETFVTIMIILNETFTPYFTYFFLSIISVFDILFEKQVKFRLILLLMAKKPLDF